MTFVNAACCAAVCSFQDMCQCNSKLSTFWLWCEIHAVCQRLTAYNDMAETWPISLQCKNAFASMPTVPLHSWFYVPCHVDCLSWHQVWQH